MSSAFASRRKPRKIGGDDEENDGNDEQDTGPVVKRPITSKAKQKSKSRMSFGPNGTSMAEDGEQESEVIMPKRRGLGRQALEKSALQRPGAPSLASERLAFRAGQEDRPSYSADSLKELRDSTPSTPKTTDEEKEKSLDIAAKFGEIANVADPSVIPSESEIREKKARRARLAKEQDYGVTKAEDYISLEDNMDDGDWDPNHREEEPKDTRLIRDDEDFAEGFDEFVEDGRISLGKKAEREHKRKQREEMRELIDDAEVDSDEDDSDLEEKAAYEATQTRAAMGHGGNDRIDRPKTPPKMISLPRLSNNIDRLRTNLIVMEKSKTQMISRMEELRKEKADIAEREVEIQALIKEAGDNYERLRLEAGVTPGSEGEHSRGDMQNSRGLESFGAPMAIEAGHSEDEA